MPSFHAASSSSSADLHRSANVPEPESLYKIKNPNYKGKWKTPWIDNPEIRKMQQNARGQFERIFKEHEKITMQLAAQSKELEQREKELEKREARNENEKKQLYSEKEMNERATLEQKKADENILRLAEDQQREKEKLRRKIIELQKKLDAKQALELEAEGMSGALQVMKHMDDDRDVKLMNKRDEIQQNLKEKIQDLEDLLSLNQALIIQERKSNDELQDARKELINEIIDEDDEKLKDLKTQFGDKVFLAVTIALMEMNEYNPSGTYIISKLWNYKEGRKATLGEGVLHIVKKWKAQKQKGN